MLFDNVATEPYRVKIYLFGFLKRGGTVLNIPVVCNKIAYVKNLIKSKGVNPKLFRVKITEWKNGR
jgi:hypothetical protein